MRKREDQFTAKDVAKAIGIGILIALVIIGLLSWRSAHAATYYRDRYIPVTTQVCMVEFYGANINASLIQGVGHIVLNVRVGDYKYSSFWSGSKDASTYRVGHFLRASMANTHYYQKELPTVEAVEQAKLVFLKQIEEKCK